MRTMALALDTNDNVAAALTELGAGEEVHTALPDGQAETVTLIDDIPLGHKFARKQIAAGSHIIKYGMPIGAATRELPRHGGADPRRGPGDERHPALESPCHRAPPSTDSRRALRSPASYSFLPPNPRRRVPYTLHHRHPRKE